MTIRFFVSSLLMLLILSSCSMFDTHVPNITINGIVTDAYNGNPVAHATVVLSPDTTITTDEQGRYTLEIPQSAMLTIQTMGYEPVNIALEETTLTMNAEGTAATVTTQLRPNTLQGVVTDSFTNQPLGGVVVVAHSLAEEATTLSPSATAIVTGTTNLAGEFQLVGVPSHYAIVVAYTDYTPYSATIDKTTTHTVALRPNILTGQVVDFYTTMPISSAVVIVGTATATSAPDGSYRIENMPEDAKRVQVTAAGYIDYVHVLTHTTSLDIAIRPEIMRAIVTNNADEPIPFATVIATTTLTDTAVTSDWLTPHDAGEFALQHMPEHGYIQILAPGFRKYIRAIEPGNLPQRIRLTPFHAKAIYAKTTVASNPEWIESFFDDIDATELNAIVIDLKSDNISDLGLIYYNSQAPLVKELGTSADIMDIRAILAETKRRDIYTIARIHIFSHDNLLAETKPEWAAHDAKGCTPNEHRMCNGDIFYADWDIAWLDPFNTHVWEYNIQLAVEAAQLGFDEVQFDYIRFASDAENLDDMILSKSIDPEDPQPLYENIATFMETAHKAINEAGAFFSVDVFGYASWKPQPRIGQNLNIMARHADYICPMVYPSHYAVQELGFENAAAHPYEIVRQSLKFGENMVGNKRAKQRPWLQDFTLLWVPDELVVTYGIEEVQAQIRATDTFTDAVGWALWNSDNEYTIEALVQE